MKEKGFFDESSRLAELRRMGDPLEKLNKYIQWEDFREILTKVFSKETKNSGEYPPFDYVI